MKNWKLNTSIFPLFSMLSEFILFKIQADFWIFENRNLNHIHKFWCETNSGDYLQGIYDKSSCEKTIFVDPWLWPSRDNILMAPIHTGSFHEFHFNISILVISEEKLNKSEKNAFLRNVKKTLIQLLKKSEIRQNYYMYM